MSEPKPNAAIVISSIIIMAISILLIGIWLSELLGNEIIFFPFLMGAGIIPVIVIQFIFYSKHTIKIKEIFPTIFEYMFLNEHTLNAVKKTSKNKDNESEK